MRRKRVGPKKLEGFIKKFLDTKTEPVNFSSVEEFANEQVANDPLRRVNETDLRKALWRLMSRDEVILTSKRQVILREKVRCFSTDPRGSLSWGKSPDAKTLARYQN